MTRRIPLGDLSERAKENALLTLQGALKDLRSRLEDAAERSPTVRRVLQDWSRRYEPRLAFLERAYVREGEGARRERETARNDLVWKSLGGDS